MRPLEGVFVLGFSTLLPGPMATLLLAEAGAEVVKVERPGRGEDMRAYEPSWGGDSANFALLNRGKRSVALDLKNPRTRRGSRRCWRGPTCSSNSSVPASWRDSASATTRYRRRIPR